MSVRLFVIVIGKVSILENNEMVTRPDEKSVLDYIGSLGKNDERDPREVVRVFAVDERGNTEEYDVVFKGRLKLEQVPKVSSAHVCYKCEMKIL